MKSKTKKKVIGYAMIATVFIGIYIFAGIDLGFWAASKIFGATAIISFLMIKGGSLISESDNG